MSGAALKTSPLAANTVLDMDVSLQHLEEQERVISRQRRQLHRQIEFLQGTAAHEPDSRQRLEELKLEEREVSAQRRELHATIDRLRAA
jgi:chromosome segregation ATPase